MAAPSIQQPLFDSQNELKRCSKCKAALSRDQFYKNSARCDGLDDRCKSYREVCNQKNAHSPAARAARARYKKKTEVKVRYNMQRRERRVNDPVFAEKEINRQRQWRRDNIEQARARRRDRNQTVGGRFSVLKSNAKRRGIDCLIDKEFFATLIAQPCHYCGHDLPPRGAGVDRLDNSQGYIESNVVPCCGVCNVVKNNFFTHDEMKKLGAVIAEIRAQRDL